MQALRSKPGYRNLQAYLKENSVYASKVASLTVMLSRYKKKGDVEKADATFAKLLALKPLAKTERKELVTKYRESLRK